MDYPLKTVFGLPVAVELDAYNGFRSEMGGDDDDVSPNGIEDVFGRTPFEFGEPDLLTETEAVRKSRLRKL